MSSHHSDEHHEKGEHEHAKHHTKAEHRQGGRSRKRPAAANGQAHFEGGMRAFTQLLKDSIEERGAALTRVHEVTGQVLGTAREFLEGVAQEHGERSAELHATLQAHRAERREEVGAMRQHHRETLGQMRRDLHETLDASRKATQETVGELREEFQQARNELANDLREASRAWREFAARR